MHECYKNYSRDKSASSMEAAIIVEGFSSSLKDHGVIYNKMVADGDSSVYKHLRAARPYRSLNPEIVVEKIECRNHLLRNYCNKLRVVAQTAGMKPEILEARRTIAPNVLRFRAAVTKAIEYRKNQSTSLPQQMKDLKNDILNSPYHILGSHTHCDKYFCNGAKENEKNVVAEVKKTVVWGQVFSAVEYLAENARSLICDVDNNPAEHYNSIVAKYIGGKRVNYTQRGAYQARCMGAVISHNGAGFHTMLHKSLCGKSPGVHTKTMEAAKRRNNCKPDRQRTSKFVLRLQYSTSAHNDPDYGEGAQIMTPEALKCACDDFLAKINSRSDDEINDIQDETKEQSGSSKWRYLHTVLLTASIHHRVVVKLPHTSCRSIVESVLYSVFDCDAMDYGRLHERDALAALQAELQKSRPNIVIEACGIFIYRRRDCKCLAATPDGVIDDDDAIVEVKCPKSAEHLSPEDAIMQGKIKFWKFDKKQQKFVVNKNDKWYYQVQSQLNITGREKCYFAVWTPVSPYIKYEIIHRDTELWETKMLPRLLAFYEDCLLPEIVDPIYFKSGSRKFIRDPEYITEAQEQRAIQRGLELEKKAMNAARRFTRTSKMKRNVWSRVDPLRASIAAETNSQAAPDEEQLDCVETVDLEVNEPGPSVPYNNNHDYMYDAFDPGDFKQLDCETTVESTVDGPGQSVPHEYYNQDYMYTHYEPYRPGDIDDLNAYETDSDWEDM